MSKNIEIKQNEIIISLLARHVIGEERIKNIVMKGKKNPSDYIRGYNACNGETTVTELAKVIRVKPPTLTPILKTWENLGIIHSLGEEKKPLYVKLLKIGD